MTRSNYIIRKAVCAKDGSMLAMRNALWIMLVMIMCLGLESLAGQDRPVSRRLTGIQYTTNSIYGSETKSTQYHFVPGYPTLIDSLSIDINSLVNGEEHRCQDFVGTIEEVANGTKYEYTIYNLTDTEPEYYTHYYEVFDSSNRLVESKYGSWDPVSEQFVSPVHNVRHYDEAGYADSLYFSDGGNERRYGKRIFENGMLVRTEVFEWTGVGWQNYGRFVYTYPPEPTILPAHLNPYCMDNSQIWDFDRELAINTKCIPQNISFYKWIEETDEWIFFGPFFYTQQITANGSVVQVEGEFSGPPSDHYCYYYNFAGDCYQVLFSTVDDYTTMKNYTWDRELAVDDEVIPAPSQALSCYPNPFAKDVCISFAGEDKAPVEIAVYNIRGQLIRKWASVGSKEIVWDGKDENAISVSRGVYLICARQGTHRSINRLAKL